MFTIDIFCDNMEEEIIPYLDLLTSTLIQIPFLNDKTNLTKKAAVSGIASCMVSSQKLFKPYLPRVYPILH
jgi:hypothetical protein